MAKAANNLQYVPFQQIHRLFASRANPIARYARMVGTSAYGLGASVAFSLVGQTRFTRLHCSACCLELFIAYWNEQTHFARLLPGSACGLTFISASVRSQIYSA